METLLAFAVGSLFAAGIYLLMRRHLLRLFFGLILLTNAVNLLIFTMGRLTRVAPPVILDGQSVPAGPIANPVSQALILTSVVISFGLLSFVLSLIYRSEKVLDTVDADRLQAADVDREAESIPQSSVEVGTIPS